MKRDAEIITTIDISRRLKLSIIKKIAGAIAKTEYARRAINDGADLSAFKEKPTAEKFFRDFSSLL